MQTDLAPLSRWDDRVATVAAWCELDHRFDAHPRPRLLGYVDDELHLVIDLRPFPRGGFEPPFIEAMAGLLGAGCTGIVAALPGRVRPFEDLRDPGTEDPREPTSDDLDGRERVVVVTSARRGDPPEVLLTPFECTSTQLRWLPPVGPAPDDGWLARALRVGVDEGLDVTCEEAADQLVRCASLGHVVSLAGGQPTDDP